MKRKKPVDELTAQAAESLYDALLRRVARKKHAGSWPLSEELYGVPSPCIISSTRDAAYWQPQPFEGEENVNAAERALILWYNLRSTRFTPRSLLATCPRSLRFSAYATANPSR